MKKLIRIIAMTAVLCLFTGIAFAEFDLGVFRNEPSRTGKKTNQYTISIDDMEARGFIDCITYVDPRSTGYVFNYIDADMWIYVTHPDIYLANYGTKKFYPLPRIWFTYYTKDLTTYTTAIFKVNDNLYTFNNIYVDSKVSNWSKKVNYEVKMVCLISKEYKDFMDDWIANGTKTIKVRLKGKNESRDFEYPKEAQADALLLFQNFKDAGGYNLLPTNNK